jgi:3-oxoacyl-[acyl-carrier-protein] synthase-3
MSTRAVVAGIGHSVPDKVLTNQDIEKLVATSDEWIVQRTGIKERRITTEDETASTLAIAASREALARANVDPIDIELVVVGTVTGDYIFPSTSCLVQEAIGAKHAGAYDIGAACAGFIYSLATATGLIESGQFKRVLVVGVDVLTKLVDWTDRSTCVLFGDGAGAVVLEARENTDRGVLKTVLLSDGSGAKHIGIKAGGSAHPVSNPRSLQHSNHIFMAGAEVYRFAVHAMGDACCRILEDLDISSSDIDLFVPHQANLRIIKSAAERLGLPDEKVFVNVQKYGNTSGGSIPLGLYEAEIEGRLRPGMLVMTVGFGAGLVWGANLIRW